MEGETAFNLILVDECRTVCDGHVQSVAGGLDADLGIREIRLLVCPICRVFADKDYVGFAMDESIRRHAVCDGSGCPRLFRIQDHVKKVRGKSNSSIES